MRKRGRPCRAQAAVNGQLALVFDEAIEAQCEARAAVRSARKARKQHPDCQPMMRLLRNFTRNMKTVTSTLRNITGELTDFEREAA